MANTTWSTTDKIASLTLSNGNLTATTGAGVSGWVRAIDRQISGKFYWEVTPTAGASNSTIHGVASAGVNLASGFSGVTAVGTSGVTRLGSVYVDGVSAGIGLGTLTNGTVLGIALDISAQRIWYRLGAAGLWNNNAANNPATGVGGVAITSLGAAIPAYPAYYGAGGSDSVTANFGNTAFTGAVPVGFTSGFTSGATPPLNMLDTQAAVEDWRTPANPDMRATQVSVEDWREPIPDAQVTQVLAEHWYSNTNPDIQVTQVVLEHWATAASGTVQAIATQVLLEHWATVASVVVPPPATGGPIVTMIH